MAKNETNLKSAEHFIAKVLAENFNQKIDSDTLRSAAAKLCEALPERQPTSA